MKTVDVNDYLANYYKSAINYSIHLAQANQTEVDISAHAFWIDAMLKGAQRDGVIEKLNLPEA